MHNLTAVVSVNEEQVYHMSVINFRSAAPTVSSKSSQLLRFLGPLLNVCLKFTAVLSNSCHLIPVLLLYLHCHACWAVIYTQFHQPPWSA